MLTIQVQIRCFYLELTRELWKCAICVKVQVLMMLWNSLHRKQPKRISSLNWYQVTLQLNSLKKENMLLQEITWMSRFGMSAIQVNHWWQWRCNKVWNQSFVIFSKMIQFMTNFIWQLQKMVTNCWQEITTTLST